MGGIFKKTAKCLFYFMCISILLNLTGCGTFDKLSVYDSLFVLTAADSSPKTCVHSMLKIAMVLDSLKDFDNVFEKQKYSSIEELLNDKNR